MHDNVIGKIRLAPMKGKWLDCFIWDDREVMWEETELDNADACYLSPTWRVEVKPDGALRIMNRKMGEIHLARGHFGIGVVAHEIQHLLLCIYELLDWDLMGNHREDAAYLCSDLNEAFWTEYIKQFGQPEFAIT